MPLADNSDLSKNKSKSQNKKIRLHRNQRALKYAFFFRQIKRVELSHSLDAEPPFGFFHV